MIPASDAGDVDARACDLSLDGVLACYQLFGFRLIVTADLNELEPRVLDEIKTRRRVVVLYSSYSHIVARLPVCFYLIVAQIGGFVNRKKEIALQILSCNFF